MIKADEADCMFLFFTGGLLTLKTPLLIFDSSDTESEIKKKYQTNQVIITFQ